MKQLLLPALLVLACGSRAAALPARVQDPEATPATGSDQGEARAEVTDLARNLTKTWGIAVYSIKKGKRETGVYVQSNSMGVIEEADVIQFMDLISFPQMQQEMQFQTICNAADGYSLRGVKGKLAMGQLQIEFTDGHAKGMHVGQTPIDMEVPVDFVTDFALLRGLWVTYEPDWEKEFTYLDIESMPKADCVKTGTMRCLGEETLEIEGAKYETWKFRWSIPDEAPSFLWYGKEGQLIQRSNRKELWTFSASRTEKQTAIAAQPPAGPDGGKGRGKGKKDGK